MSNIQAQVNKSFVLATKRPNNASYLVWDKCGDYLLTSANGQYLCSACHLLTKCCEGGPINP